MACSSSRARPGDSPLAAGTADIPQPIVLEAPLDGRVRYKRGDLLEVGLVRVGWANDAQ
jgi:hypothetical protein